MSGSASRSDGASGRGTASVEELNQEFLRGWQAGYPVPLEGVVSRAPAGERDRLLRALLIVEVGFRRRAGETPAAAEYIARFPAQREVVEQVFDMLPGSSGKPAPRPPAPAEIKPVANPIRPVAERRPALPSEAAPPTSPRGAEPAVPPPKPKAKPKPKPKGDMQTDEDEFDYGPPPVVVEEPTEDLPAPVRGKKAKKEKPGKDKSKNKKKRKGDAVSNEIVLPLVLAIVSLLINIPAAIVTRPDFVNAPYYVLFWIGYLIFSTVVTTLALFVAAAWLDTDYGELGSGLVKIVAICLTQAWVAAFAGMIPVPWLGSVISFAATLTMFLTFFQLDAGEAINSMIIVGFAHTIGKVFVVAAVLGLIFGGGADQAGDLVDAAFNAGGGAEDSAAAQPFLDLTQKFADALAADDYAAAYALMSEKYKAGVTLDDFTKQHQAARTEYGKPLRVQAGTGSIGADELDEDVYGDLTEIPAATRRAWMSAHCVVEFESSVTADDEAEAAEPEVLRSYYIGVLIVEEARESRIGRFEYESDD